MTCCHGTGILIPDDGVYRTDTQLKPLDYYWTGHLSPHRDLKERAIVYGVFGGTPAHLEFLGLRTILT